MTNGGYYLADFTGLDLSITIDEQTVDGINDKCSKAFNTGKPCIATGIVHGDYVFNPAPITITYGGVDGGYILDFAHFSIFVSGSDDTVVVMEYAYIEE